MNNSKNIKIYIYRQFSLQLSNTQQLYATPTPASKQLMRVHSPSGKSSCQACLGPQHHVSNKFDRLETHLHIHGSNSLIGSQRSSVPPEELDRGIIPGGMAAADDEADTLAQNEGDAQEAAGTTCAFAYLFFPAFK